MPGRLGVDFGTSKTVLALWDEARQEAAPILVPRCSLGIAVGVAGQAPAGQTPAGRVSVVPSLVHYAPDGRCWVGAQVHSHQVYDSPQTLRWMKRCITRRSDAKLRLPGREVSSIDAGRDFLAAVLGAAGEGKDWRDADVAFTVPIESFEHYREWLAGVAETAGLRRPRFIDAASAAVLGYGLSMSDGEVYLVFDFGGSSIGVSILLVEGEANPPEARPPEAGAPETTEAETGAAEADAAENLGRRYHVLGKASADLGGTTIDQWLFEDVLARNGHAPDSAEARALGRRLLVDCERCKERLSRKDKADVSVLDAETGVILSAEYHREQFEKLLESHGLYERIKQVIGAAMEEARTHGCEQEHITAALMVGGGSLIPSVQRTLQGLFGEDRVRFDHPLDAPARGAAAFAAGADFVDFLQHDYAIRHINPATGAHDYRPIVRRGTVYPTAEPVAKLLIKASHENQAQLGIALFEMAPSAGAGNKPLPEVNGSRVEVSFDSSGAVELTAVSAEDEQARSRCFLNEHRSTFLSAEPPGAPGEPRFEVHFDVDAGGRLLVTAQDLKTGQVVVEGQPVVKLV